jgi:hypothetical protein
MKKIIFIFIIGIVMLGFCELAFRVVGFYPALPLDRDKPGVQSYYWVCDEKLGWLNRADGTYDYDLIAANPHSSTDENGFRNGYKWSADTTNKIVLFVGDSFVFGAEVEDDQTICSEVTKLIEPKLGMVVLNSGVRGYSTVQSKRMMEKCLSQYDNIVAVVYVYCGNDVAENIDSDAYAPAKAPIVVLDKVTGKLEAVNVKDPVVPWGNDFISLMEKKHKEQVARLASKRWDQKLRDRIREHSALFHAVNEMLSDLKNRDRKGGNDSATVAPGSVEMDSKDDYARDTLIALMREMDDICNKREVEFVVTSATTSGKLQGIDNWCETAGIDFIDVSAGFTKSQFYYMARRRDRVYDSHYNPQGTKIFAKEFVPQFKEIFTTENTRITEKRKRVAHEFHE